MKRPLVVRTEKEIPTLPIEIWNLIALEMARDEIQHPDYIDYRKLKSWTKISFLNQSFREQFSNIPLTEIFPTFPKGMLNFESFSKEMRFQSQKYPVRHNITKWLSIAIHSENYHHLSQVSKWVTPIESFTVFIAPIMKTNSINKKTYGGQIDKLVKKIGKEWDRLKPYTKTKLLYLMDKLFHKYHKKPLPTVKKPCENTKYGCLMAYNKEWRKEGELNGKRGKIYSDSGVKLYLGAFKPLMAIHTKQEEDVIYRFTFQHYNGDKLRHHNILREANDRLSSLTMAMKEVKSLL